MMIKYLIGIIGITGLMMAWVIVQTLWRKVFSEEQSDSDVLAGRSDCGSCGCTTRCVNKQAGLKN